MRSPVLSDDKRIPCVLTTEKRRLNASRSHRKLAFVLPDQHAITVFKTPGAVKIKWRVGQLLKREPYLFVNIAACPVLPW